jgi:subtilisin family serine protease
MARSGCKALLAPLALLCATTAFAQDDGRYMVKFRDLNGAANAIAAAGGRVVHELGPQRAVAAYLPAAALDALRRNPNVEYVEVDPRRYPMGQVKPYGITMVQADDPSFDPAKQAGVMVCIIDSGYQRSHEDLQDSNVTGTIDSRSGNWYEDSCGHGSHVAGTIAALNNTVGVVGVAGGGSINLHIEKVFSGSDCAWAYSSNLVTALNRCRTAAADASDKKLVVNMSLGGGVSSRTEQSAFQSAYDAGVLSVAAAGNDGSTRKSYPAAYASVISVAAVDSNGVVADFSQKNDAVELAAPGVGVLSTTPFKASTLKVGGNTYLGANIDGSARVNASGPIADGGRCTSQGPWSGQVVLCERGDISFADKVNNVRLGGGAGAVIYNNVTGGFAGTLNGTSSIPAISISQEDGNSARSYVGQSASIENEAGVGNGYESYDGTSMATPHVAGVAALVWGNDIGKTNAQIRDALQKSARDLGPAGKDNSYGYGLVQAKDAVAYLVSGGGGGTTPTITLGVKKVKSKGGNFADLTWSGATTTNVTVHRNTSTFSTANDGAERDGPLSRGSYTYKVCDTSNSPTCSTSVTVTF